MSAPPLRDGAILIHHGKIKAIGASNDLSRQEADEIVDLTSHALLPGLVNPHVHLELSLSRAADFAPDPALSAAGKDLFVDWLEKVISQSPTDAGLIRDRTQAAMRRGIAQTLRFGVSTVGDISRQVHITRPMLNASPLRAISFGEIQAMAQRRQFLEARLRDAADTAFESERMKISVSPHAPYSVEPDGYLRCLQIARDKSFPLATHLAESSHESQFLGTHSGPFRELWNWLNAWDENVPFFKGGPIRFAKSLGLLDHPSLLAHVNYCDDDELEILQHSRASVVYCPRTHAFFNHPPHRWREMLARGINVAVGTDSTASSPDLNPVEDIRLLHRIAPEVSAITLWQLITTRAARALCLSDVAGSLVQSAPADIAVFPIRSEDPLIELLESSPAPFEIRIDGIRV
ncbi:MAG: amidohydrolase family protein [Planctomycetota bacterium]|nr:amidohydrolase family protein [Planctomycetota bacterium]